MQNAMTPTERMERIDALLSHVWMVRAFLKHSDEAAEDEELSEVHRELYDVMHSLGASFKAGDADEYLRQAQKKLARLKKAAELFAEVQPQISTHTNFQMAQRSLQTAMKEIAELLSS